jgi:membrane protein
VLLITISIGATFYEHNVVRDGLTQQIGQLIGESSAKEIEKILMNASMEGDRSVVARIVGIAALIISGTTVFMSLQLSINKVWSVRAKPKRGLLKYVVDRLLSLAMIISIGFILLVSLVIETLIVFLRDFLEGKLGGLSVYLFSGMSILLSVLIVSIIFGLMFMILPDAKIKWRDVWVGSLITGILFSLGKYLIGFYLGTSSLNTAYGAAGSLVIILLWVYYSAIIFLYGAKLTYAYAEVYHRKIVPNPNAVRVETVEMEKDKSGKTEKVEQIQ